MRVPGLLLLLGMCSLPTRYALAQADAERHDIVRAGLATLQVTIRGHGEPIVFIPSRGRGTEDFDDLSKRLVQAGYQAILPEPRGIGGSTGPLEGITYHDLASDVAATIRSVVGGPATIIGHAFGTRVARALAADHPDLVKQLILLSAGGLVPRSPQLEKITTRFWETDLPTEDRLAAIRRAFFASGNELGAWGEGWYFGVARAQRAADARTPLKEWWSGGSAPILVLQGTEDVIAVPENAKKLAAEFPSRVTLVEIPKAGHAMLPEQPDQIASAILGYLRRRVGFSVLATSANDHAKDVFYTTSGAGTGAPNGAELFAIEVSESTITTTDIGSTRGGDCASLALSPSRTLFSMCGPLFGNQQLATIDPKTGLANLFGVTVSGLSVMALTFAPDGTLYAVGDCNPDANFECNTSSSSPDPNYNSLYTVNVITGTFTRVGSTGAPQFFMDLAFDREGHLFGVTTTDNPSMVPAILYRIDPATGAATKLVNLMGSNTVMGLAFGRESKLYATDFVQNPRLYLIDTRTGLETAIAALPFGFSSGLELANPRED
jgi:pimeloyl-ACP methyl ester carboxylesterase